MLMSMRLLDVLFEATLRSGLISTYWALMGCVRVHMRIIVEFGGATEAAMWANLHIRWERFYPIRAFWAKPRGPKKCAIGSLLLLLMGLLNPFLASRCWRNHHLWWLLLDGSRGG